MDTYEERPSARGTLIHLTAQHGAALTRGTPYAENGSEEGQKAPLRETKAGTWTLNADSIHLHQAGWVNARFHYWIGAVSFDSNVTIPATGVLFIEVDNNPGR